MCHTKLSINSAVFLKKGFLRIKDDSQPAAFGVKMQHENATRFYKSKTDRLIFFPQCPYISVDVRQSYTYIGSCAMPSRIPRQKQI